MKNRVISMVAIVVGYLMMANVLQAGTFTTNSLAADVYIGISTNPIVEHVAWVGDSVLYCGGANYEYNKGDMCAVVVFQLPDLGGETIASANLTFTGQRQWETVWNIDLYGVRSSSSSSAVITNDYGFGPGTSGTLIQDDIMTPGDANTTWISKATDVTGDANLASWLTAQYASVGAGGYVFLRFNPDNVVARPTGDANTYLIAAHEHTTEAMPALTITTQAGAKGFEIITK